MKIIHTADLHLGSPLTTHLTGDKNAKRKNELLQTFLNLIAYANQNQVTAIIIAGDFFDANKLTQKTKHIVFDAIASAPNIGFYYLVGNHDESVLLESGDLPQNLVVFDSKVKTYDLGGVTISGVVLTQNNFKTYQNNLHLQEHLVNIMVLHGEVNASKTNYESIDLKQLEDKNITYLALGHYHSYQEGKLGRTGNYAYSGCLEGRGFDETGQKGFVLLTVEQGKLSNQFVPFGTRVLHKAEVDVTGLFGHTEQWQAVSAATKHIKNTDLVEVTITGKTTLDQRVDVAMLSSQLNQEFFFAKVKKETKLQVLPQELLGDQSLKGEFVRMVWNSALGEEEKNRVLTMGMEALNGAEVEEWNY